MKILFPRSGAFRNMADSAKPILLVADDEPSTLALVTGHLRAQGYNLVEATDGDQAWQLATEHLPNLVVLDVMMPGMSGWEVCRKIREAVSLAHTGVIMLTGIGESLNELTSPLYGADAYVDKPFEFSELDRQVRAVLARRKSGALGRPTAETLEEPEVSEAETAVSEPESSQQAAKRPLEPTKKKRRVTASGGSATARPSKGPSAPKKKAKKGLRQKAPPKKASPKKAPAGKPARRKRPGRPQSTRTAAKGRPARGAKRNKPTAQKRSSRHARRVSTKKAPVRATRPKARTWPEAPARSAARTATAKNTAAPKRTAARKPRTGGSRSKASKRVR